MKISNSNGIPGCALFCVLLTIAFVVLKLCKVITWAWVWVLAPLWVGMIAYIIVFIVLVIILTHIYND